VNRRIPACRAGKRPKDRGTARRIDAAVRLLQDDAMARRHKENRRALDGTRR